MIIQCCPKVGGSCRINTRVQKDTFFLAEPFKPEQDRKRRKTVIEIVLKEVLKDNYSTISLKVADKDPKESLFCDICRILQSSAYGIVDITNLNPNVFLEIGMLFALGKQVFIIVKKGEEESLIEKLPSDIIWKRVIPYAEFIDIKEELIKQISNRRPFKLETPLGEEIIKALDNIDPEFSKTWDDKVQKIKKEQEEILKQFKLLSEKANLNDTREDIKISSSLEKQINELHLKLEHIESLVGFPKDIQSAFMRGNWHYHKKEYDKALDYYNWALSLEPHSINVIMNKAVTLRKLWRLNESIMFYDKILEINPNYDKAWVKKGISLSKLGKLVEGMACFDKAIDINPKNEDALTNKGISLVLLGKIKEGITLLDKVITANPDDALAWMNKGVALTKIKKFEKANAANDKAISINPNIEEAWVNKGANLLRLCKIEQAKLCYKKALNLNSKYIPALINLAEALIIEGDLNGAERLAGNALYESKNREDKIIAWFLLITTYFLKEENKKAEKEIELLIEYLNWLKDFKILEWDFSILLPTIENLNEETRKKLYPLIAIVSGETNVS